MTVKMTIFTIIITLPIIALWLYSKKNHSIDYRKLLSYFLFGSWFGMCGEVFIDVFINKILQLPIPLWEYRILPIHNAMTSSYGPIMWGLASVAVGIFHNYILTNTKKMSKLKVFLIESSFLMFAELYFDISGYFLFNEYFFYYYSPEFMHFSAFVNIPMWWCGYKMMVKVSEAMERKEKITIPLAAMMIITIIWGF